MFNNMKIGVRMGLGFALVLILLVATLAFAAQRMGKLNGDIQVVVEDLLPKTVLENEVINLANANAINTRDFLLADESQQKDIAAKIEDVNTKTAEALKKLEAVLVSDDEKLMLNSASDARKEYVDMRARIIKLANDNKQSEAKKLLVSELPPLQETYLNAIHDLIQFQTDLVDESGKGAISLYNTARKLLTGLAAISILLAIVVADGEGRCRTPLDRGGSGARSGVMPSAESPGKPFPSGFGSATFPGELPPPSNRAV